MVRYIQNGSLFESKAEAIVNPVNCRGVMGKGIALEFKHRFPDCFHPYKKACDEGQLVPGVVLLVPPVISTPLFSETRPAIVLFPTKDHWRDRSRIEWIEAGLAHLKERYQQWGLRSIAMPQVGCGLGGLPWEGVQPIIEQYFADEPLDLLVYLSATRQLGELSAVSRHRGTRRHHSVLPVKSR